MIRHWNQFLVKLWGYDALKRNQSSDDFSLKKKKNLYPSNRLNSWMITVHPAPSAQPLGWRGLNLMRISGFVLMWKKPAATESVAQDERENLPLPPTHRQPHSCGWHFPVQTSNLHDVCWGFKGSSVGPPYIERSKEESHFQPERACVWQGPFRGWPLHFNLFNNQCENVWSDSCFTDVAGMCFA